MELAYIGYVDKPACANTARFGENNGDGADERCMTGCNQWW